MPQAIFRNARHHTQNLRRRTAVLASVLIAAWRSAMNCRVWLGKLLRRHDTRGRGPRWRRLAITAATLTGATGIAAYGVMAIPASAYTAGDSSAAATSGIVSIVKTASPTTFSGPGQTITYTYTVTNGTPAHEITVTDSNSALGTVCGPIHVPANKVITCNATYTTTETDVENGRISDTATASGANTGGQHPSTVSTTQPTVVDFAEGTGAIGISIRASAEGFPDADEEIVYTYTVTNASPGVLTGVNLTDDLASRGGTITCLSDGEPVPLGEAVIPEDGQLNCTDTITVTEADVRHGSITNTAIATGRFNGEPVTPAQATATVDLEATTDISISKSASIPSFDRAGTPVTYYYDVTNDGNVTATNVQVHDRGLTVMCPTTTLVPGEAARCSAAYTTTQADVDRGEVTNSAMVTSTADGEPLDASTTEETVIPAAHKPGFSISKVASTLDFSRPGVTVTYTFLVTNTGNVTLRDIAVIDNRLGPIRCPQSTLAPAQRMICTATYVTTAADVARGRVANIATGTGRDPAGAAITAGSDDVLPDSPLPGPVTPLVAVTG